MIFRPELAKQIRAGRKTQVRRVKTAATCRYVAGKSYAVQPGRGRESICRITVTDVRQEPLGAIGLRDARREGFVTTQDFFDHWEAQYGRVDRGVLVWVISFQLGDQTDAPRLLAARPGAPHGDYVSEPHLAMAGEPEAVAEGELNRFATLGHARDALRGKDPDVLLRNGLMRELERWEGLTGGVTDRDRQRVVEGIRRQLRALDRKLKVA